MRRGWMAGSHDANIYIRAAAVLSPDVYPRPRISCVPVAVVPAGGFDGHIAGSKCSACTVLGIDRSSSSRPAKSPTLLTTVSPRLSSHFSRAGSYYRGVPVD